MNNKLPYILYLETATRVCSVVIAQGNKILAHKETSVANSHSSVITVFAEEVLNSANITFKDLDAVCVSKGPGSYTGLRIGVSTAKGFCYALDIPLIAVNTLQSMAKLFSEIHPEMIDENTLLCPMIDARRMEVYSAFFDNKINFVRETTADIIDEHSFSELLKTHQIIFFGDGAEKCRAILSQNKNAIIHDDHSVSAKGMINFAVEKYKEKQFEDIAYFEPFYLKDFLVTKARNILTNP